MSTRPVDAAAAIASRSNGVVIRQSGPVQMPFMTFQGDEDFRLASVWTDVAARNGAYFHPWHNWFLSAAHTEADVDEALVATDAAFAAVARSLAEN